MRRTGPSSQVSYVMSCWGRRCTPAIATHVHSEWGNPPQCQSVAQTSTSGCTRATRTRQMLTDRSLPQPASGLWEMPHGTVSRAPPLALSIAPCAEDAPPRPARWWGWGLPGGKAARARPCVDAERIHGALLRRRHGTVTQQFTEWCGYRSVVQSPPPALASPPS